MKIAGLESEKVGLEAALKIAQGTLAAAKAIVDGPGYHLAKTGVQIAEDALEAAKKAGDATLHDLEGALDKTTKAQNALIDAAEKDLAAAQKECNESKLWTAATKALDTFIQTKATLIADADKAVAALDHCAEKIAYDAATATLAVARAGTKEINVVNDALKLAQDAGDAVAKVGTWMVDHTGNVFNITQVTVRGKLSAGRDGKALRIAFKGTFAGKPINEEFDFTPGKAEDMLKVVFRKLMEDVKNDIVGLVKKI